MPRPCVAALLGVLIATAACTDDQARRTPSSASQSGVPTTTGATPDLAVSASPTPVTAGSATPSASPSDSRRRIRVGTEAVAGVAIGTPAAVAERRLRQALGVPVVREFTCDSFLRRTLSWGTLTAYLEPHKAGGARVLEGWVVAQGRSRFRYTLPYDVQPQTRVRDALQRVPDAEGHAVDEGPFTGSYFVNTQRQPDLFWMSEQRDGSGAVNEIHFAATGCD